jgi:hypothetical protein
MSCVCPTHLPCTSIHCSLGVEAKDYQMRAESGKKPSRSGLQICRLNAAAAAVRFGLQKFASKIPSRKPQHTAVFATWTVRVAFSCGSNSNCRKSAVKPRWVGRDSAERRYHKARKSWGSRMAVSTHSCAIRLVRLESGSRTCPLQHCCKYFCSSCERVPKCA